MSDYENMRFFDFKDEKFCKIGYYLINYLRKEGSGQTVD